jgi:hypothetical protein
MTTRLRFPFRRHFPYLQPASPDWVCSAGAGRRPPADRASAHRGAIPLSNEGGRQLELASSLAASLLALVCMWEVPSRASYCRVFGCVYTGHMFLTALSIAVTLI